MDVKDRIKLFLKHLKIGQAAFEKKVGLSNGYINNMTNNFSPEKLQSIHLNYPELNIEWLILGIGEMIRNTNEGSESDRLVILERVINSQINQIEDLLKIVAKLTSAIELGEANKIKK